jgi:hypothetical protein
MTHLPEGYLERIKEYGGYREVRLLEDGSVLAIGDLIFTRAIYMDADENGWGRRFCFENKALADAEFARLANGDQEPTGWIARR